jgi:hypothetical protein
MLHNDYTRLENPASGNFTKNPTLKKHFKFYTTKPHHPRIFFIRREESPKNVNPV